MLCEYCNTRNSIFAKFCQECGTNLQYKSFDSFISSMIKVNISTNGESFERALEIQKEMLDNLPNFAWIKDLRGQYLFGNKIYAKVNDIIQADITGKTDYDFYDKKLADKYINDDQFVIESKQALIIEEPFVDNSLLETIKVPLFDNNSNVVAVIGVARYISHRGMQNRQLYETNLQLQSYIDKYKSSEAALKLSEMSINLSSTPFFWVDLRGNIKKVNDAACKHLGYSKEELASMAILDIDPDFTQAKLEKNSEILRKIGNRTFETRHRRKNGTVLPVEITTNLIVYNNDEYHFAFATDLTERKKNEQELIKRNRELEELIDKYSIAEKALKLAQMSVEYSSTPFHWVGSEGQLYKVNQSACEMLGYSKEEMATMTVFDIDKFVKKEHWQNRWTRLRKERLSSFETVQIKKDGSTLPVEVYTNFIEYEGTEFLFAYIQDISERKKLEKALEDERKDLANLVKQRTLELDNSLMELKDTNIELENAIEHKNRFISSMSHELRTPLNAIIGFTQALEKQYFGVLNEKQLEYVKLVENSGQHLLALINDILDASKIDTGAMDFTPETIDIEEIIKETVYIMESQFAEKNINFSYSIDIENNTLVVDIRKFKQILLNLLSNSLKFTPSKGSVSIQVVKDYKYAKFSVIDNGYGIKEKDKEFIFNEFYQSDEVKEKALGGAGIGLSLVKRLVKMHNGEIGFGSKENEGSTFWFTIPL